MEWGTKPEMSFKQLRSAFEMNLSTAQQRQARVFLLFIDLNNAIRMPSKEKFDKRGQLSRSTLKELIANRDELPDYFFDFYSEYDDDEERKKNLPKLLSKYYSKEIKASSGFLREFLTFEQSWRIVTTAYRAKKLKLDIAKELQYEDEGDPIVSMMLTQAGSVGQQFVFPYEYRDLEGLIASAGANPMKQYKVLAKYRFDHYENSIMNRAFTMESVMAYMMRLWILEEYYTLNEESGLKILREVVESENEA